MEKHYDIMVIFLVLLTSINQFIFYLTNKLGTKPTFMVIFNVLSGKQTPADIWTYRLWFY